MAIEFYVKDIEVAGVLSGLVQIRLQNAETVKLLEGKDFSGYKVIIKNPKKKSETANSYMWKLCDQIADQMSRAPGESWTKEDIYREAIRQCGVYDDVAMKCLTSEKLKVFTEQFCRQHIGYFVEELQSTREWTYIRCYYGSSSYTQQELSRVIDYVVRKALDEGVDPSTPAERQRLLNLWGQNNG